MRLEEIAPKPNLLIFFEDNTTMCSIIAKNSIICIIKEGTCTNWDEKSLADFCNNMFFIDACKITKVVDWNLEENNIIYRRTELTKEEISKMIGISSNNWIYKK